MEEWSLTQSTERPSFGSLIAGRAGRKRSLHSERELQVAAINLIVQNQNISTLLLEKASGDDGGADGPKQRRCVGQNGASLLECELRRQADDLGVPVSLLSVRTLIDRISALHQESDSAVINSTHRAELMRLLRAARELLDVGAFSPKFFWQEYYRNQPVLEVVHRLHTEELLSLEHTLQSDGGACVWLVSQLQSLCGSTLKEEDEEVRHQILITVACVLVRAGFEDVQDSGVSHSCCSVLDSMLTWLLDSVEEKQLTDTTHAKSAIQATHSSEPASAASVWMRVYKTSVFGVSVSEDTVRRFFTHTLTHILTYRPRLKVSEAIAMQRRWSFAKTSSLMKSLFLKVCVLFGMEQVCSHLQQVLETLEVNWQNVLSCISTLLVYHSHTQACLKELLSRLLISAFQSYDVEKLVTAFLLARQGALEGPAIFPSYSDWFKMAFGGASGYHGSSKKSLVFMLKFLSDLVPFDPPQYLKVHVMHPPYVPGKHRSLLHEFISLSRTRLSDLKVSIEQMGLYEVVSGAVTEGKPECVAQQDVEKAIALFESTGKISATVMEASIFRRPYFLSMFLPSLLTPRLLPKKSDTRMSFIEALRKAEKIPVALYSAYTESCMKEQQRAAVSDSQEHTPQLAVQSQLQELKRLLSAGAAEGAIRAQMALLSHTLSSVCDHQPDEKKQPEVVTLTLEPPPSSNTAAVVNVILQGFCECVLAACRFAPPNRQCQWVEMFLKILLGHTQLYTHTLHRVLQLLHLQGASLSPPHVLALAVLVVELHVCKVQIPLVELHLTHTHPPSNQLPPSEALSQALPSSTDISMKFTLRFCVAAVSYAVCRCTSDSKELKHFIPSHLYKQLMFLMPRLVPELRAGVLAAVMRKTEVSEVDDEEQCVATWASLNDSRQSVWTSVKALWRYASIRNLQNHPPHQLSLSDWLMLEVGVQRSKDFLSDTDRQMYEQWACQQWFLPLCVNAGGCEGNTEAACTHIINTVLDTGLVAVQCSCLPPPHTDSCRVDLLARLQELLWEVQVTWRRAVPDQNHFLWDLIDERCSRNSDLKNISMELELQRIVYTCNSVILAVPSPHLVSVRSAGGRRILDCQDLMQHINTHQRKVCVPAELLTCSLTAHFLSAVLSASVSCDSPVEAVNTSLSQLSLRCPLLLLSAVRWWVHISPVVCSQWERVIGGEKPIIIHLLRDCSQWACRLVRGLSVAAPSAPALLLAGSLHSALEQQGGDTQHVKAALTQQTTEVLVFLLFLYVTDFLSAYLTPQADRSVTHAKHLSVHLVTLLKDSSDWLSLFHQSEGEKGKGYSSFVSMVTAEVNLRLMPFAFFSVLLDVDVCVLSRVMAVPGFLCTAVMSYAAMMKLFLYTHTTEIRADTLQQTLCRAQQMVLQCVSRSCPGSITHSQWSKIMSECMELDPEVAGAISTLMNPDDL